MTALYVNTAHAPTAELDHQRYLAHRLHTVAAVLTDRTFAAKHTTSALLDLLVRAVRDQASADRIWLLQVAVSGRFPDSEDAQAALRAAKLLSATEFCLWLLDDARAAAYAEGASDAALELVVGGVVVDVDYTSQHDLHSGIQRVVRSTVPNWALHHDIVPVSWVDGHRIMRRLQPAEADRVLQWETRPRQAISPAPADQPAMVVPWKSTIVVMEVPARPACERIAAIGQFSGNRVVALGYDCIPVVNAPSVPLSEPNRFVHYLTAIKHANVVAAISASAAAEFSGFKHMISAQGLAGPSVVECALPLGQTPPPTRPAADDPEPLILCVGSFEPRKNQLAVLFAAETLWRAGLRFRLRFVGASGWGRELPRAIRRLRRRGRPVEQLTALSERGLDESYRAARFSVFLSTHEGFGLPVAESLAHGVPVLVSNYGSIMEIAAAGGTLPVSPRDDDAIVAGMRRLLTDDNLLGKLRAEIAGRPSRDWTEYADDLWRAFDLTDAPLPANG